MIKGNRTVLISIFVYYSKKKSNPSPFLDSCQIILGDIFNFS